MTNLARRLGATRYAADQHYTQALQAFDAKRHPEAQKHIENAIDLLPNHAEYQAMLGWIHLRSDATKLAQTAFDLALQANPYEMLANYGKGMLAYRDTDWEVAGTFFFNALAAQPDRPETQYYLALVSHRLDDNTRARHWMQAAEANFASVGDDRVEECQSWIREFEKLLRDEMSRKS